MFFVFSHSLTEGKENERAIDIVYVVRKREREREREIAMTDEEWRESLCLGPYVERRVMSFKVCRKYSGKSIAIFESYTDDGGSIVTRETINKKRHDLETSYR